MIYLCVRKEQQLQYNWQKMGTPVLYWYKYIEIRSLRLGPLITVRIYSRVTLYTAGHLHTAVPHCSHSRAPIVHTAVLRENNEHGCVYLRCRAVCKLPGCVEGHPWYSDTKPKWHIVRYNTIYILLIPFAVAIFVGDSAHHYPLTTYKNHPETNTGATPPPPPPPPPPQGHS